MKKTLSFLFCVLAISAFAQPVIQWQRTFGGSGSDYGYEIQPTTDGGYVIVGLTYSSNSGDVGPTLGTGDYWVLKIDATGNIQWQRTMGGSDKDGGRAIQQTADGGYILGGETESDDGDVLGHHGNEDIWIVKLDATGNIEWQRALGGTGNDYFGSVQQTSDGGYFVCGTTGSVNGDVSGNHGVTDMWTVKLDSVGAVQWQKALGGSQLDSGFDAIQTSDGGFAIAGQASSIDGDLFYSNGDKDVWIVKLTAEGAIEWNKIFGGALAEYSSVIRQTSDGGYVVTAYTHSSNGDITNAHGSVDAWVLKLSAAGVLEWQRTLGGTNVDVGGDIIQTDNGEYIVTGSTASNDGDVTVLYGNTDVWVVKLEGSGNLVWQKTFGGSEYDLITSIEQTDDDGFIFSSSSWSTDGDVMGSHGNSECWVVKLSSGITTVDDVPAQESSALSVFPNPTSGLVKVSLDREAIPVQAVLSDVSGKVLYAKNIDSEGFLDVADLSSGVYHLKVTDSNGIQYSEKILKL